LDQVPRTRRPGQVRQELERAWRYRGSRDGTPAGI